MKAKVLQFNDLKAKKPAELKVYISEMQHKRTELLQELHTNKSKQTHQLGLMKRSVAQARTILVQTDKESK